MAEEFTKLDALLRDTAASQPSSPSPDFRPAVFAEIARRRDASPWLRFLNWLDFTEPLYAPRPAVATLAVALALALGVAIPLQLHASDDAGQRTLHALKLDIFAPPLPPWKASH